jgi:uncharacterized protein (DUF488 family)
MRRWFGAGHIVIWVGYLDAVATLYTIGYGNRTIAETTALLAPSRIHWVVDVRSTPGSRFMPEYNRATLERELRQRGFRYVFMGDDLGGRPERDDAYDQDGRVDYRTRRTHPEFIQAVDRLATGAASGHMIALICSELRPEDCHRTKLVAAALVARGIDVKHIDEHGDVVDHDEVLSRLDGGQLGLLGEDPELHRSRRPYRVA